MRHNAKTHARLLLAAVPVAILAVGSGQEAGAQSSRPGTTFGASSGASAAQEPASAPTPAAKAAQSPRSAQQPVAKKPAAKPTPPATTGSVAQTAARPLTGVSMLHIELLPLQGEIEKCGLEAPALQQASVYPLAAGARLKVGRGTLTHMHVRLSAVYVRRLEHCMLHTDVRVSTCCSIPRRPCRPMCRCGRGPTSASCRGR